MELVLSIAIVVLAATGLATGLMLMGKPPQTSCGGLDCIGGGQCAACPRRGEAHHD
ncbi:MAG: hypothetical protein KKH72_03375 [Alphaproteobacteria bacterium]|nr:hypothetical protein [Alphaproteobacteria bacterium]